MARYKCYIPIVLTIIDLKGGRTLVDAREYSWYLINCMWLN